MKGVQVCVGWAAKTKCTLCVQWDSCSAHVHASEWFNFLLKLLRNELRVLECIKDFCYLCIFLIIFMEDSRCYNCLKVLFTYLLISKYTRVAPALPNYNFISKLQRLLERKEKVNK